MSTTRRRPSALEFALLGLLSQHPCSGYDLRKLFVDTPIRHFSDSPGSIYPALRRMKARKWIAAVRETNSARKREVFHIERAGRIALSEWLNRPFDRQEVIRELDTLLLRFAFFDGNLSKQEACSFLAKLERELSAYISELETYAIRSGLQHSISTAALAFANGVDGYRAQLSWARQARKALSERSNRSRHTVE